MSYFDPLENDKRIREGLLATIAHRTVEFAKENANLIVVFDDPFTQYSGGRVESFQQYVYEITGKVPVYLRAVPACLKIFFRLDIKDRSEVAQILKALESPESIEVYRSVGISQVQYAGKIIPFSL